MIKIILHFFVLLIFASSCDNNRCESPKEISMNAFECIKNIQDKDFDYFKYRMLNRNDLLQLTKSNKIKDSTKNFIKDSLTEKRIENELLKSYNNLKKDAIENNIICNNIKYIDFTSEDKAEEDIEICKGLLYFSYNGHTYSVDFTSFKVDRYYKLVEISNIHSMEKKTDD